MFSAFVHRRPWFAALVGLLLGPFIGMLYLGQGARALGYFALGLAVYGLPPVLAHLGFLPIKAETVVLVLWIAYRLGGAVHCERIARRLNGTVPAAWFSRWYLVVALGIVLPLTIRVLIWEPYTIPSSSMEPSLRLGDYFVVSKLPYLVGRPQRGDIVVFLDPQDSSTYYVKRLAGLPGDRIQMKAGALIISGARVRQEEVEQTAAAQGDVYRETLPNGRSYLVLDLLEGSRMDDSDVFEVPAGHYFFLGDNRDNSLDSRIPEHFGYVPHENFIGRVSLILWNSEAQKLRFALPE